MAKRKNKKTNASKTIKQNKKKTLKQSFASDVKRLNKTSYSQNFASYNDIYGSEDLDYDLIDGLYESTILNRVLRKIASDAVPEMFTIQVVDMEGERIPEIEQECFRYTAALKRKHIKEIYLTQMKYGTAFLYIGNKEDDRLVNLFSIHPKDIKPEINESDGEIEKWVFKGGDSDVDIPPEDILCLPYDRQIGEIYGMSFLGRLVQTLHLLLNTELNMAEIVDKFAVPILQWLVEVEEEEELGDDELEDIVKSLQNQLEYSNDIVTTNRITTDTVGFAENQYDMIDTLTSLKESFGLLTFPMALIGGRADNLSAIKVQAAQYINDLKDLQMDLSDDLVEQLYEPFIQQTLGKIPGEDYANIYLIFPVLTSESNSDAATWIFPALRHGLISRDEARSQLNYRGKALNIEEIEFVDPTLRELQEQNMQSAPNDSTDPGEPKNRSGKGDPKDTKNNP